MHIRSSVNVCCASIYKAAGRLKSKTSFLRAWLTTKSGTFSTWWNWHWRTQPNILGLLTIVFYWHHIFLILLFFSSFFLSFFSSLFLLNTLYTEAEIKQISLCIVSSLPYPATWKMVAFPKTIATIGWAMSSWPIIKSHTDNANKRRKKEPHRLLKKAGCSHFLWTGGCAGHRLTQPMNIFCGISAILEARSNTDTEKKCL